MEKRVKYLENKKEKNWGKNSKSEVGYKTKVKQVNEKKTGSEKSRIKVKTDGSGKVKSVRKKGKIENRREYAVPGAPSWLEK